MMLHRGNHDLVAGLDVFAPIGLSHKVYSFRRTSDEDYLVVMRGIDEVLNLRARTLVLRGGSLAQQMNSAMHVRIVSTVVVVQSVQHGLRLLCRRRVVQVNQRL